MLDIFIGFVVLSLLAVLQSAVASQITLLRGAVDLLLLGVIAWTLQERAPSPWRWGIIAGVLVIFTSALPAGAAVVAYLLAAGVTVLLRGRVWEAPMLAMLVSTFIGTVITHAVSIGALAISGNALPWQQAINLVTLPSMLLNLLLAVPAFALLRDLANMLYPEELEV